MSAVKTAKWTTECAAVTPTNGTTEQTTNSSAIEWAHISTYYAAEYSTDRTANFSAHHATKWTTNIAAFQSTVGTTFQAANNPTE